MNKKLRSAVIAGLIAFFVMLVALQAFGEIQGPVSVSPGEYFELFTDSGDNILWLPTQPAGLRYGEHNGIFCSAAPCSMAGKEINIFAISAAMVDDQIVQSVQTHTITVSGDVPDPPTPGPDPPPKPTDKVWVVVIEESAERTPEQARLLVPLVQHLRGRGHNGRIIDDDQADDWAKDWIDKAGEQRPFMFITTSDSPAKILYRGPLPDTLDDVMAEVAKVTVKPSDPARFVPGTIRRIN